jgi:hypothetical protein
MIRKHTSVTVSPCRAQGPTVMGHIPQFSATVFPADSLPLLSIVSQFGLVLFMFVVGMELDLSVVRHKITASIVASLAGILVPFAATVPLAWLFFNSDYTGSMNRLAFYMFLAVIIGISALPVLARIISEYRMRTLPLGGTHSPASGGAAFCRSDGDRCCCVDDDDSVHPDGCDDRRYHRVAAARAGAGRGECGQLSHGAHQTSESELQEARLASDTSERRVVSCRQRISPSLGQRSERAAPTRLV